MLRAIAAVASLACVLFALPAHAADGKRVALIIGNSSYQSGGNLPNPANDAGLIARKAQEAGFEVTRANDLNGIAFRQALVDFRRKADFADVAMVYYAGHGIEANGENWLVPVDAVLSDPRDLPTQAIRLADVIGNLDLAKVRVILLDACRNNPFKDKWVSSTRSFQAGLSRVDASSGSLVIFAADQGSAISDGQEGGNSYFAKSLANRLVEPGLALQMLGNKVADDVRVMSGGVQRPFQSNSLSGMELYLVPKPADPNAGLDSDDATFLKAQQTNTAEAYLDYLTKFPGGKSKQIAASLYSALSRIPRPIPAAPEPQAQPPAPAPAPVTAPASAWSPPVSAQAPAPAPSPAVATSSYTLPAPEPREAPVTYSPAPAAPAPQAPEPQVYQTRVEPAVVAPAPAPVVAPPVAPPPSPQVVAVQRPAPAPITQAAMAPTAPMGSIYVAPAPVRLYEPDGFPILPNAPAFAIGPYPTCKDNWRSVIDPKSRAQTTVDCKNAFSDYRVKWLNKYRDAMNDNVTLANRIYSEEVVPRFNLPGAFSRVSQFQRDTVQRGRDVADGGRLMTEYEAGLARWKADFDEVIDSYNRATGCAGYPTPAGLAQNPYC